MGWKIRKKHEKRIEYQRTVENWVISGRGTRYERLGNWKKGVWKRMRYRRIVGKRIKYQGTCKADRRRYLRILGIVKEIGKSIGREWEEIRRL